VRRGAASISSHLSTESDVDAAENLLAGVDMSTLTRRRHHQLARGELMSDPKNPSGALPGDPRYGLSEEQLKQYYMTKSPSWCIRCAIDPNGGMWRREANSAPHREYLRSQRDVIRFAGPLIADDGTALVFSEVTITPWSSSMEIRQADYARTEGWQQFAITGLDGPEGEARRNAVREDHHKFQASVMDRYVARGPLQSDDGSKVIGSFMIVEFPDRAACDEFWAKEPLNSGRVFADVTIEAGATASRWAERGPGVIARPSHHFQA
jgi:uncharacterized protein YciI